MANGLVPDILKALRKLKYLLTAVIVNLLITFVINAGVDDPDNAIANSLTEKYLKGAEMGNFTSMTPGRLRQYYEMKLYRLISKFLSVFLSGLTDVRTKNNNMLCSGKYHLILNCSDF